jgi:hypothetical protein
MQLRLDAKQLRKSVKFETYGPLEALKGKFGAEFGDLVVDLTAPDFDPAQLDALSIKINGKKRIDPSLLFGASKPHGSLPQRPLRQRFSHTRIFGQKSARITETDSHIT